MKHAFVRFALIAGLGIAVLSAASGGATLATQHINGTNTVHIVATQHINGNVVTPDTQHLN